MNNPKAVIFVREFKPLKKAEASAEKWGKLYELLGKSMNAGVEMIVVHSPEVLGDTYEELVANLSAIASHKLKLMIVAPEEAGYKVAKNSLFGK